MRESRLADHSNQQRRIHSALASFFSAKPRGRKLYGWLLACLAAFLLSFPLPGFAEQVSIVNPSFEDDVIPQGSTPEWLPTAEGWSLVPTAGTWRPSASEFPAGPPDGVNVGIANSGGSLSQILPATLLTENFTYVLSAEVGRRTLVTELDYGVQLVADGEILAQDDNTLQPAAGEFLTSRVHFTALPDDPRLGSPLEIKLVNGESLQVSFDSISLEAIQVLTPIADQEMNTGESLTVPITAASPLGDPVTLEAAGLPSFATFTDNGNGTGSIEFLPGDPDAGVYPLEVTATTGEIIVSDDFVLTVNGTPVITFIDDVTMEAGESLTIPVTAIDPDGDPLTLSAAGLPPFADFVDNGDGTGSIEINTGSDSYGAFPISVMADDGSISVMQCFLLTVTNLDGSGVYFSENFESGAGCWEISNGVWEIGAPNSGPGAAHEGLLVAGTILGGDYPTNTDSRLITPALDLQMVTGNEEIHLRFWHWFSYSSYDSGTVQISEWDDVNGDWLAWASISSAVASGIDLWTLMDLDITAYAGKRVRFGFSHVAARDSFNNASESTGWYIDDIEIVSKVPVFTGDFETGWADWTADGGNGVWEVGTPTAGPSSCYSEPQCAGTVLGGNYAAHLDSRLVSAPVDLQMVTGNEEIHLRFWHWFSYSSRDSGTVQISEWDDVNGDWLAWASISSAVASGIDRKMDKT